VVGHTLFLLSKRDKTRVPLFIFSQRWLPLAGRPRPTLLVDGLPQARPPKGNGWKKPGRENKNKNSGKGGFTLTRAAQQLVIDDVLQALPEALRRLLAHIRRQAAKRHAQMAWRAKA
jgi:hypothetical protein